MSIRIGNYRLKNDIECKVTADGFEIFATAVEKYGIDPQSIHTAQGRPGSADWGMLGSIYVFLD